MAPPNGTRWPRRIAIALACVVLAGLLGYATAPWYARHRLGEAFVAADADQRAWAVQALVDRGSNEPWLLDRAVAALPEAGDEHFRQLVAALDAIGQWQRRRIPASSWRRWLGLLAASADAEARISAVRLLAAEPVTEADTEPASMLAELAADDDPDVRLNALVAAARRWARSDAPRRYERIVADRLTDREPAIAREAWLLLGLIDPVMGYGGDWRSAPPEVAGAMLWAAIRTNPAQVTPALEALHDQAAPLAVRAAAVYALHESDSAVAIAALRQLVESAAVGEAAVHPLLMWRAVLALPAEHRVNATWWSVLQRYRDGAADELAPLLHATAYRHGSPPFLTDLPADEEPMILLADLEGRLDPARGLGRGVRVRDDMPALLRLSAAATNPHALPWNLRPVFDVADSRMRDRACLIAAERFDEPLRRHLIADLLDSASPDVRIAGAMLSGLTGLMCERVAERVEREVDWPTATMMRVGVWMADAQRDVDPRLRDLLKRSDLPRTTILLAMLHRGDLTAVDELLNPAGEPADDLLTLLDEHRWWFVLSRFLPRDRADAPDPPPFWVWADRDLQRFQLNVLRNWWLLYGERLTDDAPPD